MRAFYAIAVAAWDAAAPVPDAVAVSRTDTEVYVLTAVDPHPNLEAVGATRLGAHLSELAPADAAALTTTLVARTIDGAVVWLAVPTTEILPTDEDLGDPPLPRVVFAGDDPAAYA